MNKYDEIMGAIMRAETVNEPAQLDETINDALMLSEINCTQAALLLRSVQRRADAIVQLATI